MASILSHKIPSILYCQTCGAANSVQASHCINCQASLSTSQGGSANPSKTATGLLRPATIVQQRYRIREVEHSEKKSAIYKAEDTLLGNRPVLLREIQQGSSGNAPGASKQEIETLASLIHPNLPRIYDYFTENQLWYITMDFLPGESLAHYVQQQSGHALPVAEVIDIGIQLSTVLDYLHLHTPPLTCDALNLHAIWRTPDGQIYLLGSGITLATGAHPTGQAIANLGRILQRLLKGTFLRRKLRAPFSRLPGSSQKAQQIQLGVVKGLIQQMVHRRVRQRPYTMGVVKQELQHLVAQFPDMPPPRRRLLSRRTFLQAGAVLGGAGLAAISGYLAWQINAGTTSSYSVPDYSTGLGGTIHTFTAGNAVLGVAWSPDGKRLVMGTWNNQVQTWEANSGQQIRKYSDPHLSERIETVAWLPDGKSIAAAGDDNIVWLWDAATGQELIGYHKHSDWVISIACSPNGRYIASGGKDKSVQVWETASGEQVASYKGHTNTICSIAWSPDGRYIASAGYDMTVQIWEAATARSIFTYHGHTLEVYAVAWSPDGQFIASGGKDLAVRIWPAEFFEKGSQEQKLASTVCTGHTKAIQALAWSPDSRFVASTAENVRIWKNQDGTCFYIYNKHTTAMSREVQTVAWSPNGKYIASAGMEGTVQVWNAP